ncbi:calcium:proton antiporter [Albidovulum sp.]|uniref:calcium:proton antiporter n=1 Tax=Albidovulum sp. TaxID=1872424 RepID=UPI0039B88630
MTGHTTGRIPFWPVLIPLAAALVLIIKHFGVIQTSSLHGLLICAVALGGAVFAAVHHAEVLALKLGEPFGSILLAVAVTIIEVALIVSILSTDTPGSTTVARDTVYATLMIVLNGVVGLCLISGGWRHREQAFRIEGAAAALAVLGTLATLALILPNFTRAVHGPYYAPVQLGVIGVASLALYVVFVFVQTVRHRDYFVGTAPLADAGDPVPSGMVASLSLVLLLLSLTAVILLAKAISKPIETLILSAGLPQGFLGVVIAALVLLPEGIASVRAALANQLQNSINLALGSAIASIGLTIPIVSIASLVRDDRLVLGISPEDMILLLLTLFVGGLTLGTGRTTVLQGAVHLVIFCIFLLLSAVP